MYPDYRTPPEAVRPERPTAQAEAPGARVIDASWSAIVEHWRLVHADLAHHFHVDLYDPAVLARPWPGIRNMIFSLLDEPTRLRAALTKE